MLFCRATLDLKTIFYRGFLDEFNKENRSSLPVIIIIGRRKKYLDSKNVGCVVNKCNYISVVCRPTSDQETPFYRIFPVEFNKENRSSLFPITLAKQFLTAIFK
jgi:hypothetical protein